jgi:hypothetical protein
MSTLRRIDCAEATDRAPVYVLGALDARESAEVREHLATCGHAHPEFAELGSVVPYLAEAVEQVEPPPALKDRVMAAVEADVRARHRDEAAAERLVSSIGAVGASRRRSAGVTGDASTRAGSAVRRDALPVTSFPDVQEAARRSVWASLASVWQPALAAAAVVLIVALGGTALTLGTEASRQRSRADLYSAALSAAARSDGSVIAIVGTDAAPGVRGFAVLAGAARPEGYLVLDGLGPAPAGRTYQAWYLTPAGPRSAGLVEVGSDGLAVLPGLAAEQELQGFGLTLEQAGGAQQPTLPILAQGSLQA